MAPGGRIYLWKESCDVLLTLDKGHWKHGKKHFFMSMEEWKCFTEAVAQFDEDLKIGATLTGSTQISLSYIIFSIYSFAIIYNFILI